MKAAVRVWGRWQWEVLQFLMVVCACLVLAGCDSGSSSTTSTDGLPAPTVQSYTGDTYNVLDWEPLVDATGYNVYVTTDGSDPVPGEATLLAENVLPPFIHGDWMGEEGQPATGQGELEGGVVYRYVVTALFGAVEGPCSNCVTCALELPGGGIWRIEGLGNNLSVPMLFSEGRGLSGLTVSDDEGTPVFTSTGLRTPTLVEVDGVITTEPVLLADDLIPAFDLVTKTFTGEAAYAQGTDSSWQADWFDGSVTPQFVTAGWGDNLTGHQWTAAQDMLRVEVNLSQVLPEGETMTAFEMISLFGGKYAEYFGATGLTFEATSRVVYTPNARLTVEDMNHPGTERPVEWNEEIVETLYSGAVWNTYLPEYVEGDSLFAFGAEINGSGSLTYGYIWDLNGQGITPGWYRLTLSLDPEALGTTLAAPAPLSETEVSLYADPVPIAVNTFLAEAAPIPVPEVEGDGPLFPAVLEVDAAYAGEEVYKSVLYIYLAPGN